MVGLPGQLGEGRGQGGWVGLGVGIVAQAAWGYFGGDDASADLVKGWLD